MLWPMGLTTTLKDCLVAVIAGCPEKTRAWRQLVVEGSGLSVFSKKTMAVMVAVVVLCLLPRISPK